jgi:hypothetical protein
MKKNIKSSINDEEMNILFDKLFAFNSLEEKKKERSNELKETNEIKNPELNYKITFNPNNFEVASKIIDAYIKNEIFLFQDIIEDAYELYGEKIDMMYRELRMAYIITYLGIENEFAEKMDSNVRNIDLNDIKKKLHLKPNTISNMKENINFIEPKIFFYESKLGIKFDYYYQLLKDYLIENEIALYRALITKGELRDFLSNRVNTYFEQINKSSDPLVEREVYFNQMFNFN